MSKFIKNILMFWDLDVLEELNVTKKEIHDLISSNEEILVEIKKINGNTMENDSINTWKWVGGVAAIIGVGITLWYFGGSSDATLMTDLANSLGKQSKDLTGTLVNRIGELEKAQIGANSDRDKVLLDALEEIQKRLSQSISNLSNQITRSHDTKFSVDDIFRNAK